MLQSYNEDSIFIQFAFIYSVRRFTCPNIVVPKKMQIWLILIFVEAAEVFNHGQQVSCILLDNADYISLRSRLFLLSVYTPTRGEITSPPEKLKGQKMRKTSMRNITKEALCPGPTRELLQSVIRYNRKRGRITTLASQQLI